jgi:hypothetical protein
MRLLSNFIDKNLSRKKKLASPIKSKVIVPILTNYPISPKWYTPTTLSHFLHWRPKPPQACHTALPIPNFTSPGPSPLRHTFFSLEKYIFVDAATQVPIHISRNESRAVTPSDVHREIPLPYGMISSSYSFTYFFSAFY